MENFYWIDSFENNLAFWNITVEKNTGHSMFF